MRKKERRGFRCRWSTGVNVWIRHCDVDHGCNSTCPPSVARCKNNRSTIIFEIVNSLSTAPLIEEIVTFVEEFVPKFPVLRNRYTQFEEALQRLTKKGKLNYSGFIVLPVNDCQTCGALLPAPNPPSSCMLYTLSGPKASTKLTLRCQECKVSYGRSMTIHENGISSYYANERAAKDDLVEVTNVVYMEKKLYRWIPSLM